ncbi:MAG: hypothetical protein FJ202_12445 [Gemmatimonadetes bacterium]|nr:hypothetical protein [Gemmatimonadota bacterium]
MGLTSGARLGPYEIHSLLGAGGMGEVYRARDPRLGRDVAIKVLPAALSTDASRLHRFEQEARAAAALNHPNIVAVYDLGTFEGSPYIVSELLEGATLRTKLEDGALPVRRALDYAVQIAHGLGAAHDKGIVHRDLKPDNIFVTPDGRLKILDFGLAKLTQAAVAAAGGSIAATAAPDTLSGMVLGTVGYMAPEQVRGIAADQRADIFAFGAILYEMLAGARAFQGDSAPETMTAILKQDPPHLSSTQPHIPAGLTRIVNRCLEKNPAARFRSIDDVAFALEALSDTGAMGSAAASGGAPTWASRALFVGALAFVMAALVLVWRFTQTTPPQPPVTRVDLNLPTDTELPNQTASAVALSPDGRTVAFVGVLGGVRQVYLRSLDQLDAVPLRGTDNAQICFFSPDGGAIGFISTDLVLRVVSLTDRLVSTVTRDAELTMGAQWLEDGNIVFTRGGALWRVPAAGGSAVQLTQLDTNRGEVLHGWPTVVEGTTTILFAAITGLGRGAAHIESLDLVTGTRRVVVDSGSAPAYAASGHLVFFRDGALLAAPFDPERVTLAGPAVRVTENLGLAALTGTPIFAVSRSGSLLYVPNNAVRSRLVWAGPGRPDESLSDTARIYRTPSLGADGRTLVVQSGGDLWMQDIARGTFTRITSEATMGNSFPVLTRDGMRVIFRTLTGLHWLSTDGSGTLQQIAGSTTSSDYPSSVSPDGRTLAFTRQDPETSGDVYVLSLDGGDSPRAVVNTPAYEGGPQFSRDGRWMTFVSDESGRMEVYVRPYPGPDRRWQVSTNGGTHPRWNGQGTEVFYRNGNRMMAVSVSSGSDVAFSPPRLLFEGRYAFSGIQTIANFDVHADGRFVMVKDESDFGRLNLVLNWFEELRRLAPAQ